jgi:uncharacterized protein CbrC (UPF0167 family)
VYYAAGHCEAAAAYIGAYSTSALRPVASHFAAVHSKVSGYAYTAAVTMIYIADYTTI